MVREIQVFDLVDKTDPKGRMHELRTNCPISETGEKSIFCDFVVECTLPRILLRAKDLAIATEYVQKTQASGEVTPCLAGKAYKIRT